MYILVEKGNDGSSCRKRELFCWAKVAHVIVIINVILYENGKRERERVGYSFANQHENIPCRAISCLFISPCLISSTVCRQNRLRVFWVGIKKRESMAMFTSHGIVKINGKICHLGLVSVEVINCSMK